MTRSIRGTLVLVGIALAGLAGFCAPASAVTVSITGPEETVFDYTTMRCDDTDFPDGPAQVFRDSLGRLQLIVADGYGHRMIGPDFDHLTRDCTARFLPAFDPNPAHYNYGGLMYSLWTLNGQDVYALIHSEWHGYEIPGACPATFGRRRCGSGAVTFAASHDAGDTWVTPAPPDNLVATIPPRPTIDDVRTGLFSPTNLIQKGSYWYSMMLIANIGDQDVGACPMRT